MVVQIPDIDLTVQIDPGQRCFDLNEEEKLMGPDDWAWRFLRLNKRYQNSYLEAYGKRRLVIDEAGFRPKPISWNLEILPEMIRTVPVDEHICRDCFGISTWLDPKRKDLPKLPKGDSWFSPLKCVISEPRFEALKHDIFGYQVLDKHLEPVVAPPKKLTSEYVKSGTVRRPQMDASVWFLIDCTIPPDGQVESIRNIAEKFASHKENWKLTSKDFVHEDCKIERIADQGWVAAISLPNAAATISRDSESKETWRLARVCLTGPILSELEKCRVGLLREHESVVKSKLAAKPFQQRFRPFLDGTADGVGLDGNALKAYLVIAEFNEAGITDSEEIIKALANMGAGSKLPRPEKSDRNPWLNDIEERAILFDNHAKRGQAYIDGGYKWLIHSQNPPRSSDALANRD